VLLRITNKYVSSVLQSVAVYCYVSHVATYLVSCSVLQCVAVCWYVSQEAMYLVCCSVLLRITSSYVPGVLQCVAVYCSVSHCVATYHK